MKSLFIIRHAKSSWSNPQLSDFDRPLNKRGLRDAPFMSTLLLGKEGKVDKIVSSPANRAMTTAGYFAEKMEISNDDILFKQGIYEAHHSTLTDIISRFEDSWDSVAMFGHNPGFTNLVNLFAVDYLPNLPTCGIVKVVGMVTSWKDFIPGNASVRVMYFPKQYLS